jgi:hypothetical protein
LAAGEVRRAGEAVRREAAAEVAEGSMKKKHDFANLEHELAKPKEAMRASRAPLELPAQPAADAAVLPAPKAFCVHAEVIDQPVTAKCNFSAAETRFSESLLRPR